MQEEENLAFQEKNHKHHGVNKYYDLKPEGKFEAIRIPGLRGCAF